MSRRKTNPEDIRDPEHYFNRMVALESKRDRIADSKYQEVNASLESMLEGGDEGPSKESAMLLAINIDDSEYERYIEETSFLGWIEAIKNPTLYAAVQALSQEDQQLLTYRFKECLTVRETAEIMGTTKSSVDRRTEKIKKFILDSFKKAGQTP